jgi:N-acetyl-anhydromuramyl-L-alanine amidase AmpD
VWLPGVVRLPDDEYLAGRLRRLDAPPRGIVIHSAARGAGPAEYLADEGDGRDLSCHLAWSARHGGIVQMVPLDRRAQHAGRAGNDWLGVELPGPWDQIPRPDAQREELRRVLLIAVVVLPWLAYWCRHSEIDQTRRDPGPGFHNGWLDGLGLVWGVP